MTTRPSSSPCDARLPPGQTSAQLLRHLWCTCGSETRSTGTAPTARGASRAAPRAASCTLPRRIVAFASREGSTTPCWSATRSTAQRLSPTRASEALPTWGTYGRPYVSACRCGASGSARPSTTTSSSSLVRAFCCPAAILASQGWSRWQSAEQTALFLHCNRKNSVWLQATTCPHSVRGVRGQAPTRQGQEAQAQAAQNAHMIHNPGFLSLSD
mmetsp:Transcript_33492/g.110735  ORF Transcript_33492/g.110735 Transcript_33492/m.110735 type:complete len:214 (+) Transcript_33492:359-1000(+)